MALIDLVRELCSLNDDNLAERVIKDSDVQWCLSELLDILEQEEKQNEPLTLAELREVDGQPIYVTTKNYGDGWCILNWHGVNKSYTYFSRTGASEGMTATPISAKTYGDLWLAYRRPPEGDGK